MAVQPPPGEIDEPSNRWPWLALALGALIIVVAVGVFLLNQQRTVNVTVQATPTLASVALAVTSTAIPTPTPVTPTPPPTATSAPMATVGTSPTPLPSPKLAAPPTIQATLPASLPTPTPLSQVAAPPAAPSQPTQASAATPATQPTPGSAAAAQLPTPLVPTPAPSPTVLPSPTPFAGQVANAGGLGNTRSDFDTSYGAATGETPDHLVVYRKNNFEYHVGFVPDPTGRAELLVEMSQPGTNASPLTTDSATTEAHKLLPRDTQPPNAQPEGNDQFIVERYTSQLLAQALPASAFTANQGQPGQFLVVYVRDPAQQGRIARVIVGPGTDPQALINQGR